MKFAIALLALVATSTAIEIPNLGRGELHKDLQEFMDLIPVDDIVAITIEYLAEDQEMQNVLEYLQSKEFQHLVADVEAIPEVRDLMNYVHNAGVDVYYLVNMLNEWIGLEKLTPPQLALLGTYDITGGIRGYIKDVTALIPFDKLEALYNTKLVTSKAFKEMVDQLKSENFQKIVNNVYANTNFQKLLQKVKEAGIDLQVIKDLLLTMLGIRIPARHFYRY